MSSPLPFSEATRVGRLSSHTYAATFDNSFCIGSVPNGGYVGSTILRAASMHLAERGQPDTISSNFQYLDRTEAGPAVIVLEDIKLGRNFTTLHVTVYQNDLRDEPPFISSSSRRLIVGYIINTNISTEKGLSLDTHWEMLPPRQPATLEKLKRDKDPGWTRKPPRIDLGGRKFSLAQTNLVWYWPQKPDRRGQEDVWVRLAHGGNFDNVSLSYVMDSMAYLIEAWRPAKDEDQTPFRGDQIMWYPTLTMNLDIKARLPDEGVEWLFLRTMTRQVKNGRLDLETTILDASGNLLALGSHVNLVLSADRNLAKRNGKL